MNILAQWFPNVASRLPEFIDSFVQTLVMVGVSGLISFIFATMLAIVLVLTQQDGLVPHPVAFNTVDKLIDLFRSIPFVILVAALVPFTRALVGTAIGTKGAIFPLVIGVTPFFARQIQAAIAGIDPGLVEAAEAMGMSIVLRVYLRESIPSIVRVTVITVISLVGLTAIVGIVGGGGLGDFAIRYGYQRYMVDATYATVIVLVAFIAVIEFIGKQLVVLLQH